MMNLPEKLPKLAFMAFPPQESKVMTPRRWQALASWWRLYIAYQKIFHHPGTGEVIWPRQGLIDFKILINHQKASGQPEMTAWEFLISRYFRLTFRMEGHKVRFL